MGGRAEPWGERRGIEGGIESLEADGSGGREVKINDSYLTL